jgi:ABC-type Zn uptake system ZnuABC Zn-binding protein ZnuA
MYHLKRLRKSCLLISAIFSVVLAACSSPEAPPAHALDSTLNVVTTSNIVGDWARQVGGKRVEVFSLIPVGADPHTFQPGARDVARIAEADIVFSVGLSLEGVWLDELIQNASADSSRVVALGETANPIEFVAYEEEHDDPHAELDPHFWFDPLRVELAVNNIASRLAALDTEGADVYLGNAEAYQSKLDALHQWIEQQVDQIPPERRLLVTTHDNLGYFADRYGFRIVGAVMPGVTTEQEPSAQEMAALVDEIRQHQARAIFTENILSNRLIQQIAEEADVNIVTRLHTDSLGEEGSGAETYIGLMRTNVTAIVEALK